LVRTTTWKTRLADGSLLEVRNQYVVDVPEYADGKPGELWVIRAPDGKISVVSTNFQPDHPKWPGQQKGWPVPSAEFQRKQWRIYREKEEVYAVAYRSLLAELKKDPLGKAREVWVHDEKQGKGGREGFKGPDDPAYIKHLQNEYEEGLQSTEEELRRLEAMQP
jgi:hypothetical protein